MPLMALPSRSRGAADEEAFCGLEERRLPETLRPCDDDDFGLEIIMWSSLRLLTRTRTLGFRLPGLSEPGLFPASKYSMRRDVCERLALWPRVLKVTGVPSSGREYEDLSSPGWDTSVSSSVGAGAVITDSDSVGAGNGIFFFLASPPIVSLDTGGGSRVEGVAVGPEATLQIPLLRAASCEQD